MSDVFSYDVIPYPSKFFLQTYPDRLAVLGTLFGIIPAHIETCRVLELGCGNGSNLISQAYTLPDATFVGVDLSEKHIVDAKSAAEELGLKNIEFYQMDVTDLTTDEFGTFDYITAHGLFSWVPDFVREKVLAIYREFLNENGIGYISYSAFPGAHYRQMSQRIMRYHSRHIDDPIEKVGHAVSFLSFLAEHSSERDVYAAVLKNDLKRHFEHDVADIFHDDLSEINQAFYFREFAELLEKHKLQYLGEAELHAMGTQRLSAEARELVESFDDIIEREQYLDFIGGRIFRQTLFCRKEVALDRKPADTDIMRFSLASSIRPGNLVPEIETTKRERFVGMKNVGIEIDHPLTKSALVTLGEVWGKAVAFPDLIEIAREKLTALGYVPENWDEQTKITCSILFRICLGTGLVDLHLFQPSAFTEVSDRPKTNALAAWQLPQAKHVLTLLNLDLKIEDDVSRELLRLCDGTRGSEEIETAIRTFIANNEEIDDKEELLAGLNDWIKSSLAQLAKLGVFES